MKSANYPIYIRFRTTILYAGFWFLFIFIMPNIYGQDRLKHARENMVKLQIEGNGIHDKATLAAMRKVPRHLFVPDDLMPEAYRDNPLPIGYGQTISQPYMVAYMTQTIHPRKGMRILEIGTGSGYQAAILAEIVDSVFTIEIVKQLGEKSSALLHSLGYNNVVVRIGDGFAGWPEHGPYDGIIVTAAAEVVPPPLIAQLKEDGRLIIPLGKPGGIQTLVLGYKEKGEFVTKDLLLVRFVPFVRE